MNDIQREYLKKYGAETEITACIEELSELIGVLCKYTRYNSMNVAISEMHDSVLDEYVDVLITSEYIKEIFSLTEAEIEKRKTGKLQRMERWETLEQSTFDRGVQNA